MTELFVLEVHHCKPWWQMFPVTASQLSHHVFRQCFYCEAVAVGKTLLHIEDSEEWDQITNSNSGLHALFAVTRECGSRLFKKHGNGGLRH